VSCAAYIVFQYIEVNNEVFIHYIEGRCGKLICSFYHN